MKKIIVSFSLLLTAGLSSAFASDDVNPDQKVLANFKNEFATAQNVSWEKQGEYDKASFVLAGRRVIAFFNPAGELEGSMRDIFFDQLPLAVMTAVDKKYVDAIIIDVREISNADGTNYRIRLESKGKRLSIRVGPDGNIDDVEKLIK